MKLTEDQIKALCESFDLDVEKEHYKGSTFHAEGDYEIREVDVKYIVNILKIPTELASTLVGTKIFCSGSWDSDWGCEWFDFWQCKALIKHIPEVVIPAHTIKEWITIE